MLELVQLEEYAGRRPAQLSGGQQQRVALARALINRPQVLLLDEPLGALDLKLRRSMQIELKRIQTEVGITFVHVTHDQEEAMTMADTIAVMNAGGIEQMGSPGELYEHPRSTFVANFLGQSNLVKGNVRGQDGDHLEVDVQGATVRALRDRSPVDHGRGLGRASGRRRSRCRPGVRRRREPAQRRPGHRRQLRRRQHAVPRPDAVGPGAHGVRAEHRQRASRSATGDEVELCLGARPHLPARRRPGRRSPAPTSRTRADAMALMHAPDPGQGGPGAGRDLRRGGPEAGLHRLPPHGARHRLADRSSS